MNRIAVALVLLLTAAPAAAQVSFVDRAVEMGIDRFWSNYYLTGDFGTGSAFEDFDHDGDLDVFVPGLLLQNDGDGTFTVPSAAVFSHNSGSCGASSAS